MIAVSSASSMSSVAVLFCLLMDLSAFDCCRLQLIDFSFGGVCMRAMALRVAVRWSCEATDGGTTAGGGGGGAIGGGWGENLDTSTPGLRVQGLG